MEVVLRMETYWPFFHQLEVVDLEKRYSRNIGTLTIEENESLKIRTVCVVGCGGLGGYIIEMLARIGVGNIIAIDGDVFEESNLNRQLLSEDAKLGTEKALAAVERVNKINPHVNITPVTQMLTEENAVQIIGKVDVVVDALDNIDTRLKLEKACAMMDIPLVHGAIGGWFGQVTTVMPGDGTLSLIYKGKNMIGIEKKLGNPSFTPATIASIEVSEVIKLLIGRGESLSKKLLLIDLFNNDFEVVPLSQ